MSRKHYLFLIVVTSIYLLFELAFNARLLDVVGGTASIDQVHNIEVYGRMLSGVAAALVALQVLLVKEARFAGFPVRWVRISILCVAVAATVYFALQALVNTLVANSSPEFRRQALNVVLVQRALVDGRAELDGLTADPSERTQQEQGEQRDLFARPEGKAFLALFPVLAASVDRLEEKIADAKLDLLQQQIGRELDHEQGVFETYKKALLEVRKRYMQYARGTNDELDERVAREQRDAWNRYTQDLRRYNWTPHTVPPRRRAAVVNNVRKSVPVPANWHPADSYTFDTAVESRVRQEARRGRDGSVTVQGKRVPPGLAWTDFVGHPGLQAELRERLQLPGSVVVATNYTGPDFTAQFYKPLLLKLAREQIGRYTAPLSTFERGGSNEQAGLDAARAALVPPIALLFSLLGAVGHLGKLIYLLLKAASPAVLNAWPNKIMWTASRYLWIAPVIVIAFVWCAFSVMENQVTQSRVYAHLRHQAQDSPLVLNALHVVAIGQGYGYPINEGIRKTMLRGFEFGYRAPSPSARP